MLYNLLHAILLLLFSGQVMSDSFSTPWTVAHQVPLSMGFTREEYWSGLSLPSLGDLPDTGIEPTVSCIGSWILYHWATREPHILFKGLINSTAMFWWRKIPCLFVFWQPVWVLLNRSISYILCAEIQGKIKSTGRKAPLQEGEAWLLAAKGAFWEYPSLVSRNKLLRH